MLRMLNRGLVAAVAVAATLLGAVGPAFAEDVIRLKDGKELRGEIIQEFEGGYIQFREKIGETLGKIVIVGPSEIESVEREEASADAGSETAAAPARQQTTGSAPRSITREGGTVRGAVITLEGMVGMQMAAKAMRDIIPTLESELGSDGSGVVVLKINSGGGLALEVQRLSDVVEQEFKGRFRTVAWIESAISAAAMTAHCLEEIYFLPEGNYGACTMWYGNLQASEGRDLEDVLAMMERISARGGHDYKIMRSMQIEDPLSASISETGEVVWYGDADAGEFLVNPDGRILTFDSQQAEKYRFSRGTARTLDELQKLMGIPEIEWVGRRVPGELFPISRAEEEMRRFREIVTTDETNTRAYWASYQSAVAAAQGAGAADRGRFVGLARQHLRNIERMVRNNPNFALMVFNMNEKMFDEWLREQDEMLSDLLRDGGGNGGRGGRGGGAGSPGGR